MHDLQKTVRQKTNENEELDKLLEELHVSVSERNNISAVNGEYYTDIHSSILCKLTIILT